MAEKRYVELIQTYCELSPPEQASDIRSEYSRLRNAAAQELVEYLQRRTNGLVARWYQHERDAAADIFQDAFAVFFRLLQPSIFEDDNDVVFFFLGILRRCRLGYYRQWKRCHNDEPISGDITDNRAAEPTADLIRADTASSLQRCLEKLDEGGRALIMRHHIYGISIKEIAGGLEISEAATSMRLMRAMRKLEQLLIEDGQP